jgi:hypothetical protein
MTADANLPTPRSTPTSRYVTTMPCLALTVVILAAGCADPDRYSYPPPLYARPYVSPYQQPLPITSYPLPPTTTPPPDAYQEVLEPLQTLEIDPSADQPQVLVSKPGQQEPERLYPEANNGPPPGSRTILHPFPDMRAP